MNGTRSTVRLTLVHPRRRKFPFSAVRRSLSSGLAVEATCWGCPPAVALSSIVLDQSVDETAGLQLVERVKFSRAKHVEAQALDVTPLKLVLGDEFADEGFLLLRAAPDGRCSVLLRSMSFTGSVLLIWNKPSVLDFRINAALQGEVETSAFLCHSVDVGDLCLYGDRELVAAVPRKAEAFAVIGYEFECHCCFGCSQTRKRLIRR